MCMNFSAFHERAECRSCRLTPLLLMAKRWRLPFGVATTLFTMVALFTSAIEEFSRPG
jgi:hypothetical protein